MRWLISGMRARLGLIVRQGRIFRRYSPSRALTIPVVDISPFVSGTADNSGTTPAQIATAAALGDACERVGFFYVTNHGVPSKLLEDVQIMARRFFACDLRDKLASEMQRNGQNMGRGYQQLGVNVTQGARDWHEAVDLFRELSEADLSEPQLQMLLQERPELGHILHGRNVCPPQFDADLVREYVACMRRLGAAVMRAMALSLALPPAHFEPLTSDSFWVLRFINYPARDAGTAGHGDLVGLHSSGGDAALADGATLGCGDHTDYGCLTIVNQVGVGVGGRGR